MAIEIHPMKIEDFLLVMAQNADIYPEFDELSDPEKRCLANLNIIMGTAESFFEDGRFVGVGGIRYVGIGEAWMMTPPTIREERRVSLLKKTKEIFAKTRDEHNLWRIFGTSKISENFLRHLGFKKDESVHIWTRS